MGTSRVADEEHAREIGAGRHEERAGEKRERVEPARHRVACCIPDGHAATRDRPDHGAHEERRQQGRGAEHCRSQLSAAGAARSVLERETGSSEDDPQRRETQRDEEGREDRLERRREARPKDDEDEDQPDVVRLPYRSDCPVDQRARPAAAVAAAGEEAPEPGPEIRASEHGVQRRSNDEHSGDGVRGRHGEPSATAAGGGSVSGPYGTSVS